MKTKMTMVALFAALLALAACGDRGVNGASSTSLESALGTDTDGGTAALAAGVHAMTEVASQADGSLVAKKVLVSDRIPENLAEVRVEGPVQALDTAAGTVTLVGVTFAVPATATFDGALTRLADVAVGARIEVKGVAAADGTLTANVLGMRYARIDGVIQTVTGTAIPMSVTIAGKEIAIESNTAILVHEKGEGKGHRGGRGEGGGEGHGGEGR